MKNFKIPKNILRQIFLITFPLLSFQIVLSQNISEKIFGQNAWMPNSIGATIFNGKLDSQWNKVKDSHAKICRYGGIAVDKNMPTYTQYLNIIDSIRSNGMEPVMLVSFDNNKYTASQAAQTVEFINSTSNKNVKYWVIGNEPDNSYGYVNSAQVADYVKRFSLAMKQEDASIKIIAPETAWYNQNILDGLLTPGGLNDITGKDSLGNFIVDLISFHTFPFRGIQKRNEVISYLTEPYQFEYNLTQLNEKIAACNSFHQRNSNSSIRIAVTEANIDWQNPQEDGVFGLGANSFLGGQFWAEMIGICMKKNVDFINFWSIIEGNELGYLNHSTTLPKPSYYHFKMLADNFKGVYCNGTDNNTNIKSFGSKSGDQISVIILNQDQSNDFIYKLRLDTNLISGTDPLKINIDAGTHIEYSDTIFRESTVLLIFNSSGTLNKKCVYKLYGNADQSIPPTCNLETVLPQTTIISPVNNSFFNLDSTITVLATASGGTGPIQKVEFFADTTKLSEDTIPPYSFTWNNATAGSYSLTAKVSDSVNNTFVSEIVNITVTNPLIATVTAPSNNSSFNVGATITIHTAMSGGTGTIQKVEFFADTIKLGEDTITPYDFAWNNVTAGAYALTVKATDSRNNIDVSEIINITVIIPLAATIISPANNSFFNIDSTINILATTSGGTGPIQKVEFFSGTTKLGEDTIAPHNFIWNNAPSGNYALTAKVTDSVNNTSVSQIINIVVNNRLTATVIAPINNSSFTSGSPITIQAVTSDGTGIIQKVEFFADSIILGEDVTSPYDFLWNNASAGNYALTVKATDSGNNTAVSSIINIAVIIPLSTTITSPLNNSFFIAGSPVTIQATTSNGVGAIQKVEFFLDTTKLGEDLTSPYNIIWDNPLVGNYTLTVKATDSIGNTAVSIIINITINNLLSTTIISPTNNTSFSAGSGIVIEATTSGGTGTTQKVEFFADTTKLGEDLTSPYNFIWNNATAGTYALTTKAIDSENDSAVSSTVTISVSSIVACSAAGSIAREVWSNVSGSSVSAIPLSINPSLTGQLTIFEAPQNFANNYGQRISGYVCPPLTGNYIFWIASDNNSELWLSTDETTANKQKIASVSGYTSSRQWTKYSTQKSVSKNLIAGRNYYIEALHKEGSQGDNCAVGWQLPSGIQERPIPGNRLSPFELIPSIQLISAGSSWKYLDNGTNQGTAWRASSFNDATWKTGNAEFGYGDGGEATVVSYGPSSTNKYITTYFRKTFTVIDISTISGLELSLIRDDGAVVYINGVEVYRNNLPSGTIFYNTLAPTIIDATKESIYVIANISSNSLVNGANLIAVEIHQNAKTSPDMSFNLKLKTLSGSRIMDNEITNDTTQENTILENTVEMLVYPNPNTGQFNLEFCIDELNEKTIIIEISNSLGQVIYKELPQKIKGCIKATIELEATLPTGVYIMKVTIDDKIQTAKMLLTR